MRFKFLVILFLGFLSTYAGEIKTEEICYYKTVEEYKECKKERSLSIPKYPIENFHLELSAMTTKSLRDPLPPYKVIEFKAYEKEKIQVTIGEKSLGFVNMGLQWKSRWIDKTTFDISTKRIINLEKNDSSYTYSGYINSSLFRKYKIKYIDNYGEVKIIKFEQDLGLIKKRLFEMDMIGDYLIYASNLNWGEKRSLQSARESALKENEKKLSITKSIILKQNNDANNCFISKEIKYPELTKRYKKLYESINPLRAKLDLPPSTDLKPICN